MVLEPRRDVAVHPENFTHAEIFQQPRLWPTTVDLVRRSGWMNDNDRGPVIITGAGTSAYAAAAVAASWPNAIDVATTDLLLQSREEIEQILSDFHTQGRLISLARSGDSPESVAVVKRIKHLCPAVTHLAITCNADGQLASMPGVKSIILDPRTNDRSLVMTSSFSNLILAGLCLRHANEIEAVLPSICEGAQQLLPELEVQAQKLSSMPVQRVVTLASGPLRALASETSLKVLEMTAGRVATLSETFLGLRHGPMSFLTSETLVICFLSSSPQRRRYEEDVVSELLQKGLGRAIVVAPDKPTGDLCDQWIPALSGHCADEFRVPFESPFAQLLAYHLSLKAGLDPDNPSPGGAITRVVKQFAIYDEKHYV